jgi:hypothetical protein
MHLVQSDDVLDARLISRVCSSDHGKRLFEPTHSLRPMTLHTGQVPKHRIDKRSNRDPPVPYAHLAALNWKGGRERFQSRHRRGCGAAQVLPLGGRGSSSPDGFGFGARPVLILAGNCFVITDVLG